MARTDAPWAFSGWTLSMFFTPISSKPRSARDWRLRSSAPWPPGRTSNGADGSSAIPERLSIRVDRNAVGSRRLVGERDVEAASQPSFEHRQPVAEQRLECRPVADGDGEVDRRRAAAAHESSRLNQVFLQRGPLLAVGVPVEGDQGLGRVAVAVQKLGRTAVEGKTGPGVLETGKDRVIHGKAGGLGRSKFRKQPRCRAGRRHEPDQAARPRGGSPLFGQADGLGAFRQSEDAVADPGRACELRLRRRIAQERELPPGLLDVDAVRLELIRGRRPSGRPGPKAAPTSPVLWSWRWAGRL